MGASEIRVLIAHHSQVEPIKTLAGLMAQVQYFPIPAQQHNQAQLPDEDWYGSVDLFALVVDARTGISKEMIELWQFFHDRQFPRAMIVQGVEFAESDFDDIVLIGNRVLEQLATPFLVLHDDLGQPIALISLEDNLVHDYSGKELNKYSADSELVDLIQDFQQEYLELQQELGDDGFMQGIFAIAIPIGSNKPFGLAEFNSYIRTLDKF